MLSKGAPDIYGAPAERCIITGLLSVSFAASIIAESAFKGLFTLNAGIRTYPFSPGHDQEPAQSKPMPIVSLVFM